MSNAVENWPMSPCGKPTFTHEGWTVRIWRWKQIDPAIQVISPEREQEVAVRANGLGVCSALNTDAWEGPHAEMFTIPWPVIEACVAAQTFIAGAMKRAAAARARMDRILQEEGFEVSSSS